MEKEIIQKWEENKDKLEEYFRTTNQEDYDDYKVIVVRIFQLVINSEDEILFDTDKMTVLDHGDYQGTQIFIVPKNSYQPSAEDYIMTDTYYGSCSGCDTLQAISSYDSNLPSEDQVKEYMTLALHLVQKMRYLSE